MMPIATRWQEGKNARTAGSITWSCYLLSSVESQASWFLPLLTMQLPV
jgi:hypothetical protein